MTARFGNLAGLPPLGPKAGNGKTRADTKTKAESDHMDAVSCLPCIACGRYGVEVHHEGKPRSNMHLLPLCPQHHRREYGPGAYHYSPKAFHAAHGDSAALLARVDHMLKGETWVHVASVESRRFSDLASPGRDRSASTKGMSGPALSTAEMSKDSGAPNTTRIVLPWPPQGLSSNGRAHWASKAKATKGYRVTAFWLAKQAGITGDPQAVLRFSYSPPDLRHRDVQNMPAMLKAAIDGIADAMGCDDRGFRPQFPERFGDVCPGGAVIVTINPQFEECIP